MTIVQKCIIKGNLCCIRKIPQCRETVIKHFFCKQAFTCRTYILSVMVMLQLQCVSLNLSRNTLPTHKCKKVRGGNIFAIFAGTITPQKYSLRIVRHVNPELSDRFAMELF